VAVSTLLSAPLADEPEPLLAQPAASRMLPTAAPAATIILIARKICPSCLPHPDNEERVDAVGLVILARQVHMVPGEG
jgi:hypothetical protein